MTWLSELAWRDFYFMILDRFPHVAGASFRPEYDAIVWDEWPQGLAAWQAGQTGFPGRCGDAPAGGHRLHAQSPAYGRRLFPVQGSRHRLAAGRALVSPTSCSISIWRPTTAAGSGRRRAAATRSRGSASSIR